LKLDWQEKESVIQDIIDERIQPFLFNEGSLTQFLQEQCSGLFNIELIAEVWQHPLPEETILLSIADDEATFIRKSLLKCDDKTLVYARTVIPVKTLAGENQKLIQLGEKPLGDVLFNDDSTYRSDMNYAKIPVDCELHSEATNGLDNVSELWGRQSVFYIDQQPLLITEIFLPAILECKKN
jgi:chorismate--pyruvate lyase